MNKIILVTGGNRGIGKEICRQLAKMGHTVILGSRSLEKGEATASSLGGNIIPKKLEVNAEQDIQALFEDIKAEFGQLDVLINNAGIFETESVLNESIENMQKVMNNNVFGPQRMVQVMVPLLEKSNDPRIVNVSSAMGNLSSQVSDHSSYRLSKFALNGLTLQMAHELPNMKVNAMHPGWVKTDMGGEAAPLSVEEGADTAVYLATAEKIETGKFYGERTVKDW